MPPQHKVFNDLKDLNDFKVLKEKPSLPTLKTLRTLKTLIFRHVITSPAHDTPPMLSLG